MTSPLFYTHAIVNEHSVKALIDSGSSCYASISPKEAQRMELSTLAIEPRAISGVFQQGCTQVTSIAKIPLDLCGHTVKAFAYIIPGQYEPLLLGRPFLRDQRAQLDEAEGKLTFARTGITVYDDRRTKDMDIQESEPLQFHALVEETGPSAVFAITLKDLDEALKPKEPLSREQVLARLPTVYHEFIDVFDPVQADQLPPHRPGIDHEIPIENDANGKPKELPYGALYGMSREQLLVLRKTLTELLDKGFIRESKSSAAAPVLFVKKPGGGLRFCVDYRGLNAITRKDRYPLPLIKETLMSLARARHLTKLDVIAAFHKIRMAEGEEYKTAFRTRYGLFEWLVTPFGLTGAPATFQRYINYVLRDHLDDFCSAYIDDILVYTESTLQDHQDKVKTILRKCLDARLYLDIKKCEFDVNSVKYLGYIMDVDDGLKMDPGKIEAIKEWKPPTTLREVRAFLGFTNYYRDFIPNNTIVREPLVRLTKKGTPFVWGEDQQTAFDTLKQKYIESPILAPLLGDRPTRVEPDASRYACGAVLAQQDDLGIWKPCAYFSAKHLPAECNYDIHDKELLAIVKALKHWTGELLSLSQPFIILTDHKNLEKFTTKRDLNERQMRWSQILSKFNFKLDYRPGTQATLPDTLSRREQDMPQSEQDPRISERSMILLPPNLWVNTSRVDMRNPFLTEPLRDLWNEGIQADETYTELFRHVLNGDRRFPPELQVQTAISDCEVKDQQLRYRDRIWLPSYEPLSTKVIQTIHDSTIGGHPGREATTAILSRQFYWPHFAQDIRRFIRNCDVCGRTSTWRDKKKGLLKPLPVPDRIWQEISVDFVTDLPSSNDATVLCVITDRLSKGTILFEVPDGQFSAEGFAKLFVKFYVRQHWLPKAIVSDRGVQFVNAFWKRVCELLNIERRLSTAYHPETDGATERRNQEVETYLRRFTTYAQDDWAELLPLAQIALDNRPNQLTGLTPFFLTHGYNIEQIDVQTPPDSKTSAASQNPRDRAAAFIAKLREAQDWAQTAMILSQQQQEHYANQKREPHQALRVGDKVWLNLKNVRTQRPSKKLDWIHHKYTVTKVINANVYELDTPRGIHNRFHTSLLRLAGNDPLPSQQSDDAEPPPIITEDGDEEYSIDHILDMRMRRGQQQVLVKWTGYVTPTWEPRSALEDTHALEVFLHKRGEGG